MNKYIILILILNIYSSTTEEIIAQNISPDMKSKISVLEQEFDQINEDRLIELEFVASQIVQHQKNAGHTDVIFICTHNSRRSQLAQLWLRAACTYYNIENIQTYSGGTEATAFNKRMIDAITRFGFTVKKTNETYEGSDDNFVYHANLGDDENDTTPLFSKKYDHSINPSTDFIAIMVCSQADKDCPFVPGASSRIALPYVDPKIHDGTDEEKIAYDNKVREIGREILYIAKRISHGL